MPDMMTTELQIFSPRDQEEALVMLTEGLGTDDGKPFSLVNFLNFLSGVAGLPTHSDPLEFYSVHGEAQFAEKGTVSVLHPNGTPFHVLGAADLMSDFRLLAHHPDKYTLPDRADWEKVTSDNPDEVGRSIRFYTARVAPMMIPALQMLGKFLPGSRFVLFQTAMPEYGSGSMSFIYANIIDGLVDRGDFFDGETLDPIPAAWSTSLTRSDKLDVLERFWPENLQVS